MAIPTISGYSAYLPPPALVGTSTAFTVRFTSTSPVTYQWSVQGIPIVGAVHRKFSYTKIGVGARAIQCDVTNADGTAFGPSYSLTGRLPVATVLTVGDLYKHQVICGLGSQRSFNTMYYTVVGIGGGAPTDQFICGAIDGNMNAAYKAFLTGGAYYFGSVGQIVKPTSYAPVTVITNAGIGLAGTQAVPGQACGLLGLRSAIGGRGRNGRQYIPFGDTINLDALHGEWVGAANTALTTIGTFFVSNQVLAGGGMNVTVRAVIYHRKTNTFNQVDSFIANLKAATQKRRGEFGKTESSPLG